MLRWIDVIKFSRYGNPEPERKIEKTDKEWKELLTDEQYRITRLKGTERPYSGAYCRSYEAGQYTCVCCGELLFDAVEKYNSLSGWPSFTQPARKSAVKYFVDNTFGMKRVEVLCNVCDAHLGHVFPDGPEPSGLRYCINSESIKRIEDKMELSVLGGGCFWCTEALFQKVKGVETVEPGYSGGKAFKPSYREVASGLTGHAEMVRIKFNPFIISFQDLLRIFFSIHDASLLDPEKGDYTQYRSVILYYNEAQRSVAEHIKTETAVQTGKILHTEIAPYKAFYPAEEKHQNYYQKNPDAPYCTEIIDPKLEKLKHLFSEMIQ